MPDDLGSLSPILAIGFGLIVGLAHAFEADHVVAVGVQASRLVGKSWRRRIVDGVTRSSIMGIAWGAGHATALVLFGMAVYVAASVIQDWVFAGLEMCVGVMLLVLGASVILRRCTNLHGHRHRHTHVDGTSHVQWHIHKHSHARVDWDSHAKRHGHRHHHTQSGASRAKRHGHGDGYRGHTYRSYGMGLIHGLAGSGGLVALIASAMEGPAMMLAFMLAFGTGALLGMCIAGGLLGISLAMASGNIWVRRISRYVAGTLSVIVGIMVLYQTSTTAL